MNNTNFGLNNTNPLQFKRRKKNGFKPLEEGAYPRMFIEQVEAAIAAVATDKLRSIRMVRRDRRSNAYLITMGFGKRNTWFENSYVPQGEVAECGSAQETMNALKNILKAAKAGEFDDALEDLRKRRQEHAHLMIDARDVTGFNRLRKENGLDLLCPPNEVPMQSVNHEALPQLATGQP